MVHVKIPSTSLLVIVGLLLLVAPGSAQAKWEEKEDWMLDCYQSGMNSCLEGCTEGGKSLEWCRNACTRDSVTDQLHELCEDAWRNR